jgi:hypothetical protein
MPFNHYWHIDVCRKIYYISVLKDTFMPIEGIKVVDAVAALLRVAEMPDADIADVTALIRERLATQNKVSEPDVTAPIDQTEHMIPGDIDWNVLAFQGGKKLWGATRKKSKDIERRQGGNYKQDGLAQKVSGKDFAAISYTDVPEGYDQIGLSILDHDSLAVECNDENEVVSFSVGDGVSQASFYSGIFTKIVTQTLANVMAKNPGLDDEQMMEKFRQSLSTSLEGLDEAKIKAVRGHVIKALETTPNNGYKDHYRRAISEEKPCHTIVVSGYIDRKNGILKLATSGDAIVIVIDKDTGEVIHSVQGDVGDQLVFDITARELHVPPMEFKTIQLPKNYRIMAMTDGMVKGKVGETLGSLISQKGTPENIMADLVSTLDTSILDDDTTVLIVDGQW